jgi:hypothetical protein
MVLLLPLLEVLQRFLKLWIVLNKLAYWYSKKKQTLPLLWEAATFSFLICFWWFLVCHFLIPNLFLMILSVSLSHS